MDEHRWTTGELAEATGITVRTLHHFDQIGLLRPVARSAAGHRRYGEDDVRRLYRILALRDLGVPLREIARVLDSGPGDLGRTVHDQLQRTDRLIARYRHLRQRLVALHGAAQKTPRPSIDQLIDVMEAMMRDGHFTTDQLAHLKDRHRRIGPDGFARWERRCEEIVAEVTAHIREGTGPADPRAQRTARRWSDLMRDMSGGDKDVLAAMYAKLDGKGAEAATRGIVSTDAWDYLRRALAIGHGL